MITATGFLLYYIFRTTRDPIQRPGLLFNLNNGYPTHSVVGSIVYQPSAFRSIIRWSALFHEKRCKILIPHETRGLAWTCCVKLFCRLYLLLTWLLFICLSMVCAWAAVFRIPCKTMSSLYCNWWRVSSKHKWLSWFNGVEWLMLRLLHYDLNKLKKTYFHRTKTWNTANELYILKFSSFFFGGNKLVFNNNLPHSSELDFQCPWTCPCVSLKPVSGRSTCSNFCFTSFNWHSSLSKWHSL